MIVSMTYGGVSIPICCGVFMEIVLNPTMAHCTICQRDIEMMELRTDRVRPPSRLHPLVQLDEQLRALA